MGNQRPELRVKLGAMEIDAKGVAAIRAIRVPLALVITALALAILGMVFGASEFGIGGKVLNGAKWAYAEIAAIHPIMTFPLIGAALVGAFSIHRMRKRTLLAKMAAQPAAE